MSQSTPRPNSSTGLETHIASGIAYLFGWISGLILFLIEKEDREVRFHAAQSIIVSGALTAVFMALTILGFIPIVGLLVFVVQFALGLAAFVLWIYLLVQGFQGRHVKLPFAGDLAERWAASV